MSKCNSTFDLATLEQAFLLAASRMKHELKGDAPTTIDQLNQLVQAVSKAYSQLGKGQLKGKRNNSAEQHLQNAKRLNQELYSLFSWAYASSLVPLSDMIALDHDLHEQSALAKDRKELDMIMEQLLTFFRRNGMTLTTLLDEIHAAPFSPSDILESKL